MTSLKRLLNCYDDEIDSCPRSKIPASYRGSYENGAISNKPVDQSHTEPALDVFFYPENNTEAWAREGLPPLEALFASPGVEPVAAAASQELCYGMIYRAAVKLVGDMSQMNVKLNSGNLPQVSGHSVFRVERSSTQVFLTFSDGTQFAILNTYTTKGLESVIDLPSVQFEALANLATLRETLSRATRASDATLTVNINVYGTREIREKVGCHLSTHKIYFQHPDQQRPGSTYDNLHVLPFSEMQVRGVSFKPHKKSESVLGGDDADKFQKAVSDVYASLKRGSHLKRVMGDSRLKTSLLRHQQEALDFMMQRETGPVPPEFSLWRRVHSESQTRFCHAITNATVPTPPSETGGGVLADEMGMGKSLSILSLITKTLEDARDWASNGSQPLSNGAYDTMQTSRASLVIVSSSLLLNSWLSEIETHLDGTLKITKYHGQKRETRVNVLRNSDIVLTTYHTLAADFAAKKSPIHGISWFRVVLDEAHIIRRRATTFHKTVSDLIAKFRWCLTGTPIQNRLEDIGALFTFIRASPFESIPTFRRFITVPFDEDEDGRAVASQRLALLLDSVCLRRTKDLLSLPDQQDRIRVLELSREEQEQYEQTKKDINREIRQSVGEGEKDNMIRMFHARLQLRMLCNHGTFQVPLAWKTRRNTLNEREAIICSFGQKGEVTCSSCGQSMPMLGMNHVYRTYEHCAHVSCLECLDENAQEDSAQKGSIFWRCPLCYAPSALQTGAEINESLTRGKQDGYFRSQGHSTKMVALISDVQQNLWEKKSIIFSSWTTTLNLVATHLHQRSIPFERIDGTISLPRREKILNEFASISNIPVLIMTTGTGAFGLNITAANRVFIVEPQWNPSVESQAIARALRLGQGLPVLVTRYVMNRTVEQEMLSQQDRKRKIAEMGWGS